MALIDVVFLIFNADPRSLTIEMDVRLKILAGIILVLIPYTTLTLSRNHDWKNLNDLYTGDIKFLDKMGLCNIPEF